MEPEREPTRFERVATYAGRLLVDVGRIALFSLLGYLIADDAQFGLIVGILVVLFGIERRLSR